LELKRQEVLASAIESSHIVRRLSLRILGHNGSIVLCDKHPYNKERIVWISRHAGVMQRRVAHGILHINACSRNGHQLSYQTNHPVKARQVQGESPLGWLNNRVQWINLGQAAHGSDLVILLHAIQKA
jgi:hypothetical protein